MAGRRNGRDSDVVGADRVNFYLAGGHKIAVGTAKKYWESNGRSFSAEVCAAIRDRFMMQRAGETMVKFPRINEAAGFPFDTLLAQGKITVEELVIIVDNLNNMVTDAVKALSIVTMDHVRQEEEMDKARKKAERNLEHD